MRSLSSERWKQIDALFAAALEAAPMERDAFLRERCGEDTELLEQVRSLLRSMEEAEEALGESVSDFAEPLVEDLRAAIEREEMESLPGEGRIGPYRLLRVIGRGGMGAVYLAERADEQFEKRVALKLVKRGMDTDEVLARFRYERQILAALEHPNIGRLYDGGAAEDGRPYLVMEHIAGEPVTTYCDRRRLSVDERLKIFETICGAVQYAHRNLVVHRDIKPSNILVTAEGTVKLLDFGIAKLLDPAHPELVPRTRTEMRLLTPEYASPEQIEGAPVTTASDVYALGVVLFELLTGRRPSDRRGRRTADRFGLDTGMGRPSSTVVRSIPSDTPGSEPESAEEVAARRATTPERLRLKLRGDLDTITLKALAEEPDRRYHSAEQLLADVQRYRRGLPVLARGESFGYRTSKFVRRHRMVVSFSSALAVLLIGFVGTVFLQNVRLESARRASELRQTQAEDLLTYMVGPLRRTLESIGRTDISSELDAKAAEYYMEVPPEWLTDEELFRRTEQMRYFGSVRLDLGELDNALQSFQESYELNRELVERDPRNPAWMLGLATSHFWIGNVAYLQSDNRGALRHFQAYRDLAERLTRMEPDSLSYALELSYAQGSIGSTLERMGEWDAALREFELTLQQKQRLADLQPENTAFQSALGTAHNKVAVVLQRKGKLDEALQHFRSELAVRQAIVERDSTDMPELRLLSLAHRWLGELLLARGDASGSLQQHRRAVEIQRRLVQWDTANNSWRQDLGVGLRLAGLGLLQLGMEPEAMEALTESRAIFVSLLDRGVEVRDAGLELARSETALATAHGTQRPEEALAAARAALERLAPLRDGGVDDAYLVYIEASARMELGQALVALGREEEAGEEGEEALQLLQSLGDDSGPEVAAAIGTTLMRLGRVEQARPIAASLISQGYRRPSFVSLARSNGLLAAR